MSCREKAVLDDAHSRLKVEPLEVSVGLRRQACDANKRANT